MVQFRSLQSNSVVIEWGLELVSCVVRIYKRPSTNFKTDLIKPLELKLAV